MKTVAQIFEENEEPKEYKEVLELISAYENLQDEFYDLELLKRRSDEKNTKFIELINDIINSVEMTFDQEEENEELNIDEKINYKKCLKNLDKYIKRFVKDNRINLTPGY